MQQSGLFLIIAIASVFLSVITTAAEPVSMTSVPMTSVPMASVPMTSVVDNSNTSTRDLDGLNQDGLNQAARSPTSDRTYSFTMTLPDHLGKQFARVSFTELGEDNKTEPLQFDLSQTQAFIGTTAALGSAIRINDVWIDETGTFWIEFNPTLSPKTTLTVTFKAQTSTSKTYNYSVAAYPNTQRPVAVFVGNGSVTVDSPTINLKR